MDLKVFKMGFKIIFTWWNKQTLGTFLKTLFFGKYVGQDEYGNKYYKSKRMNVGLFILKILKQVKLLQTGIYGYITQLIKFLIIKKLNILGKKNIKQIKLELIIVLSQLK